MRRTDYNQPPHRTYGAETYSIRAIGTATALHALAVFAFLFALSDPLYAVTVAVAALTLGVAYRKRDQLRAHVPTTTRSDNTRTDEQREAEIAPSD